MHTQAVAGEEDVARVRRLARPPESCELVELLDGEREPAADLGIEVGLELDVERHVQ